MVIRFCFALALAVIAVGCAKHYHPPQNSLTEPESQVMMRNQAMVNAKAGIGEGEIVYFPSKLLYGMNVAGGYSVKTDFLYRKNGRLAIATLDCRMGKSQSGFSTSQSHVTDWRPKNLKAWGVPTDVPKPLAKELLAQK